MFNFAVINLKNLIKNFLKIVLVIAFSFGIINLGDIVKNRTNNFNYFEVLKSNLSFKEKGKDKDFFLVTISKHAPIKAKKNPQNIKTNNFKKIKEEVNKEKTQKEEAPKEEPINMEQDLSQNIPEILPLKTEVISENNLTESYNTIYNTTKIKNETEFNLSQDILTPNVEFQDKKDIIIFHTHTCESYTKTKENPYNSSRKF